jgi:hypothetical protein
MHADLALARWQELRGLPSEDRIAILMADFFRGVPPGDVEYEATMRIVYEEMAA